MVNVNPEFKMSAVDNVKADARFRQAIESWYGDRANSATINALVETGIGAPQNNKKPILDVNISTELAQANAKNIAVNPSSSLFAGKPEKSGHEH